MSSRPGERKLGIRCQRGCRPGLTVPTLATNLAILACLPAVKRLPGWRSGGHAGVS